MEEWIVCRGSQKDDPRVADAVEIALIEEGHTEKLSAYLVREHKTAFLKASYAKHFERRCRLSALPRKQFV